MNNYAARVLERLRQKYPNEPEYLQSVQTWLEMIDPALDNYRYEKLDLLTRMVEPERMVTFLVPWWTTRGTPTPTTATGCSSTAPSAPTRAACACIRR